MLKQEQYLETLTKFSKKLKSENLMNLLICWNLNRIEFSKELILNPLPEQIKLKKEIIGGKTDIYILLEEDGKIFHKPSQSLLTSMHISILFAISELASELKEESYPMIFDAPTSSFGETKSAEFLNLIFEIGNQKILLVKDFLVIDENSQELSIKKKVTG